MQVSISSYKGKPSIAVIGSAKNTPEQVVKAYKKIKAELKKEA